MSGFSLFRVPARALFPVRKPSVALQFLRSICNTRRCDHFSGWETGSDIEAGFGSDSDLERIKGKNATKRSSKSTFKRPERFEDEMENFFGKSKDMENLEELFANQVNQLSEDLDQLHTNKSSTNNTEKPKNKYKYQNYNPADFDDFNRKLDEISQMRNDYSDDSKKIRREINEELFEDQSQFAYTGKMFEFRIDSVKAEHFSSYIAALPDYIEALSQYDAELVGVFATEIGELNEITHIWAFESLQSRQLCYHLVSNTKAITQCASMIESTTNILAKEQNDIVDNFFVPSSGQPVYELESVWNPTLERTEARQKAGGVRVNTYAPFTNTEGDAREFHLWRYPSWDNLEAYVNTPELITKDDDDDSTIVYGTKALLPIGISPLQ